MWSPSSHRGEEEPGLERREEEEEGEEEGEEGHPEQGKGKEAHSTPPKGLPSVPCHLPEDTKCSSNAVCFEFFKILWAYRISQSIS